MTIAQVDLLTFARQYAEAGLACIPIPLGQKKPNLTGWPQRASLDAVCHEEWFARGQSNIGIVTGVKSKVFAFDVDVTHGGLETLRDLETKHGPMPPTPKQRTGGGGFHFLFQLPATLTLKNGQGLLDGIDVRGEGGQIVAAPSLHASGNRYVWEPGQAPWEIAIAKPPTWLLELLNPERPKVVKTGLPSPRNGHLVVDPDFKPTFTPVPTHAASVVAGCSAIKACYERPTEVTEWHWKLALGIIGRTEDGRRLAHYMSGLDEARYSEYDTNKSLDGILDDERTAHTCDAFAAAVPDTCSNCPFRYSIASPLQLGRQPRNLVALQGQHFYSTAHDVYYDLTRRITKTSNDFSSTYAHLFKGNAHTAFIKSRTAPKVDTLRYMPGSEGAVVRQASRVLIGNTYLNDGVVASQGDCSILREHFEFLIPNDEGELDHLLNAMAHTLQRPAQKLRHAILIKGKQRTGKSTIATIWKNLLGASNAIAVGKEELESDFQGGLYDKQLAVFEELFIKGRDRYNDLKEIISEDEKRSQKKNVDFATGRTPFAILALSNNDLPIMIPETGDQRWFVIDSPAVLREAEYYKRLYGIGMSQLGAFKQWLLDRDITNFNPNSPPPMTRAKLAMIDASKTPLDKALPEVVSEFGREVALVHQIASHLRMRQVSASDSMIRDALARLGGGSLDQMRDGSIRITPWALTNLEKWKAAGTAAVLAELRKTGDHSA